MTSQGWELSFGKQPHFGAGGGKQDREKDGKRMKFFSTKKTKQEYLLFWWHSTCNNHSYLVNEYMKQKEQYGVFLFFVEEHYGVGKSIRFKWNYLASYFSLSPINYISCNQ